MWRYYYYSGSSRVAMRIRVEAVVVTNEVYFLVSDHLGSTSLMVDVTGTVVNEQRYKPSSLRECSAALREGETRYTSGDSLTDYQYTGQRSQVSETGLYYYNARWYEVREYRPWRLGDILKAFEDRPTENDVSLRCPVPP